MGDEAKEVRYCSHVRDGKDHPFMRYSGAECDLIVCWKCQNQAQPVVEKMNDLTERLRKVVSNVRQ